MTSKAMFFWSQRIRVKLLFIQTSKPAQNAFIEPFNGEFRDDYLKKAPVKGVFDKNGGERGIRTPGTFRFNGFQDRRFRPLSQLS